jgi:hypothetical protein
MLKGILSGSDCANCRICCVFDKYDIWETPIVDDELYETVLAAYPDTEFVCKGNSRIFKCIPETVNGEELYYCPMLDKSSGCKLGDSKPFDCRIWPYRIMDFNGTKVISIASICPEMYKKPLCDLAGELDKNNLGDIIFAMAEKNPDIVKPYQHGYPILKVKGNTAQ